MPVWFNEFFGAHYTTCFTALFLMLIFEEKKAITFQ